MGHAFIEVKRKVSKMQTAQIQKKIAEGGFNASELKAAQEVLEQRGVTTEAPKKGAAEKKATKKSGEAKEGDGEKKTAPKKKSEKVGETKSDKMRVMLKAGKTTKEIIEAFEAEQITVRYPEIRRNRLWLIEKEQWIDPHKVAKEESEAAGEETKPAPKKAVVKKDAPVKKTAPKKEATPKKAAAPKKSAAKKDEGEAKAE